MFPMSRRVVLLGGSRNRYLLDDEFSDTRAAGAVNGTPAVPGPGTRVVVDAENKLSISGGNAVFAGGKAVPAYGDPAIWYGAVSRIAGRMLIAGFNISTLGISRIGFDDAQTGTISRNAVMPGSTSTQFVEAAVTVVGAQPSTATQYYYAIVLKSTGSYLFIKGGSYTNWTLLYHGGTDATALLYPSFSNYSAIVNSAFLRVPNALWLPTPLAYDTFTRADGAIGSTETTGPDSQAVTARTWTGATFAISGNTAVNTPATYAADVIVNGGFAADTDWSKDTDWTIAAGIGTKAAGAADGSIYQAVLTAGLWYRAVWTTTAWVAGNFYAQFGAATYGPARVSAATFTETRRATGTGGGVRATAAGNGSIDNVSFQAMTTAELFASISSTHADAIVDVNVTWTAGYQAGLVVRLDSAASPANFIIAYLINNAGTVQGFLDKCVAGTYTNLIAANVTYAAGAQLRVITSGSSVSVYYNNAAVGTTQTVADAGILNNTLHGLFSTSALNSLDYFSIFPRGTSNEYSALDRWSGTNP